MDREKRMRTRPGVKSISLAANEIPTEYTGNWANRANNML